MSRKARAETWRAIAWRGEPEIGEHSTFVVTLPRRFASRYGATGRLRWTSVDPPGVEIVSVLVVDRDGDGEVRLEGDRVTLSARGGTTPEYVSRLWQDARVIFGLTRRRLGPAGGTTVTDGELRQVIAEMKNAGRRPRSITLATIAATSGTFTRDQLRYYLRVSGKRLRDYL